MADTKELLADVKELVGQAEKDLEVLGGDVEGHLRVCLAHLQALLGGGRRDPAPVQTSGESESQGDESEIQSTSTTLPEPPPYEGPGSGVRAWRSYAKTVNVDVASDASVDEVVDALVAAGILSESQGDESEIQG